LFSDFHHVWHLTLETNAYQRGLEDYPLHLSHVCTLPCKNATRQKVATKMV